MSLKYFFCLGPTDCAVDGSLFISPGAKGSDGVSSFGEHRALACQLAPAPWLPGQSVSILPHAEVEAELKLTVLTA